MTREVLSAFCGALFAFVFMWIWDWVARFNERWSRHYTGVVKLSRAANDQLASIHNAIFETDQVLNAYRNAKEHPGTIPMSVNQPEVIDIDSSFEYDLVNLDLLNEFVTHRYNVQCANRDIRRLASMKDNLERGFAEGRLKPEEYLRHIDDLAEWMRKLRGHLAELLEDATTLTARARVRAKRDVPNTHLISMRLRRTRHEADFPVAAAGERIVLVKEIESVSEASIRRIEKISRKACEHGA